MTKQKIGSQKALIQLDTEQFLTFSLSLEQQALLPTQQLLEIVKVNLSQITAIAGLEPYVMGIYNWRGDVIWVVDLASMLGFTPIYAQEDDRGGFQDRCHIIFLRSQDMTIGFAVPQVGQMVKIDTTKIQASAIAFKYESLADICSGYWLNANNQMLLVLDGVAIIQRFK